jgi:hypothetical protein
MKRIACSVLVLAGLAIGSAEASAPVVKVDWSDPSTFPGIKQDTCRSVVKPEEWLGELAEHLQRRAANLLDDGQTLEVTFTDVRRAGQCEPWRGAGFDNVRVIKETYPSPQIDLHYVLRGADGTVIREGDGKLRDPAFMQHGTPDSSDPLRYEKRLLDDWLRKQFPRSDGK